MIYLAYIKNLSQRYEIRVMCDNFYNKLNNIYHNSNAKNNCGKKCLHKNTNNKGVLKKNSSLPFIHQKFSSK